MSKRIIIVGLAILWLRHQDALAADEADDAELKSIETKSCAG